jgi:hypothetical protein
MRKLRVWNLATMRKVMMPCLALVALASLLIADTIHGPGPFNPNDYYSYWNMGGSVNPQPPGDISFQGDPYQPYHCYAEFVGVGPDWPNPDAFSLTCAAYADAYITGRQDITGGTTTGYCNAPVNDNIYAANQGAGTNNEIDGGVLMSVPSVEGAYYSDIQQCTATDGCTTVSNGGPRDQDCSL